MIFVSDRVIETVLRPALRLFVSWLSTGPFCLRSGLLARLFHDSISMMCYPCQSINPIIKQHPVLSSVCASADNFRTIHGLKTIT